MCELCVTMVPRMVARTSTLGDDTFYLAVPSYSARAIQVKVKSVQMFKIAIFVIDRHELGRSLSRFHMSSGSRNSLNRSATGIFQYLSDN